MKTTAHDGPWTLVFWHHRYAHSRNRPFLNTLQTEHRARAHANTVSLN